MRLRKFPTAGSFALVNDSIRYFVKRTCLAALPALLFLALSTVQGAPPSTPPAPLPFPTPVTNDVLDPDVFIQWVDGAEVPFPPDSKGKPLRPQDSIWSVEDIRMNQLPRGIVKFGDSKTPGPRYLRIGFKSPVEIGSVLVHGDGQLSVLKPDAPYPGKLDDDSQWIPAQRIKKGKVVGDEAAPEELAIWVLPPGTSTRALRFTHVAQINDNSYAGVFRGAYLLSPRLANLSPQALVSSGSMPEHAGKIIDETYNNFSPWNNIDGRDGTRAKTIEEDPEWIMLTWPAPVTLDGLATVATGFASADVQVYTGPDAQHPSEAKDDEWKTIGSATGLNPMTSAFLPLQFIEFDAPVTTRAIRLRITASLGEREKGTLGGKRIWLDELMALHTLGDSSLASAVLPVTRDKTHAPIAINFSLPEDGFVTLVIDDANGKRVRNLISDTPFPKGDNTVYWDGTDDLKRDADAARHGLYSIPAEMVDPGTYHVRGLWHKQVDLNYQMSVYYPGTPPWSTQDTSGGWMTNHTPAVTVLFIPPGQIVGTSNNQPPSDTPLVFIGAPVSEGGSAVSWVDLDGKKKGGRGWIGGAWTGASYFARDAGTDTMPGVYAYVGCSFLGNANYGTKGKVEIRLTMLTSTGDKPVLTPVYLTDPPPPNAGPKIDGLAVHNSLLVASLNPQAQLLMVDVKNGTVLGTPTVADPRGVAFDSKGRLLVLSGKTLLRYTLGTPPQQLGTPETLVSGLDSPSGLTVDAADHIYITDQGNTNQVKTFSPDGQPLLTIGHPGPLKAGAYDPLHMNNPRGITVDSNGRIWVAEDNFRPKRVSIWNADGTLWKAFYGPGQYGGGGALDPQDGSRFSYDGMEFHVDWDKGTWALQRVYYQPGPTDLKLATRMAAPEAVLYINGKRYMTDAYNSSPTSGSGTVFLFLDKGDVVVPVAAIGRAIDWDLLKGDDFKALWPAGTFPTPDGRNQHQNEATFLWSDLNNDGQVQPNEVQIFSAITGGVTVANDGSFIINNLKIPPPPAVAGATPPPGKPAKTVKQNKLPGNVVRFKPVKFTDQGVPVYDSQKMEILGDANGPVSSGGDQALVGTNGWTIVTNAPPPYSPYGLGGIKDGVSMWSYPSLWPGLHASHESPAPDHPGELVGTTRLLGDFVTPKGSDAGPLFFINSNQGDMYVFTQDGLFVTQLFQDVRQGPLWQMPIAEHNMLVNNVSLHDENFFPTVTQVPDGSIYVDSGALSALVKVNGLESVHRIEPMSLQVSADDLKLAQDFVAQREAARQAAQGSGVLGVALQTQPPALDANPDPWADNSWALIDERGVRAYFNSKSKPYDVQGAVTIAGGNLYAMWKTGDPQLLVNSGAIDNAPFKTGGALDLMIGTNPKADPDRKTPVAGDLRLLVTQVQGKTKAILYRQVVPGTPDAKKVPFSAPWHSINFDSVTDVSDKVQLAADKTGDYEISVPLALLGLNPTDGTRIKGDIGILRGDGTQTTQRVYWNNKATAIVSDVPSEAELTPALWGIWEFRAAAAK
jgi:hypothetical protein